MAGCVSSGESVSLVRGQFLRSGAHEQCKFQQWNRCLDWRSRIITARQEHLRFPKHDLPLTVHSRPISPRKMCDMFNVLPLHRSPHAVPFIESTSARGQKTVATYQGMGGKRSCISFHSVLGDSTVVSTSSLLTVTKPKLLYNCRPISVASIKVSRPSSSALSMPHCMIILPAP